MKLERFSAEQFAGARDLELAFDGGMNVVVGDNESGKSTALTAIYHAITTPSRLDRRSDRDFIARCFPSGGAATIDTELAFEAEGRRYTLQKIWDLGNEESRTKLRERGGDTLRGAEAEERLRALRQFGPAVYDNLIFGRQSHEAEILAWCYGFFDGRGDADMDEAKRRIAAAFSAAGGISEERFAALLDARQRALAGHWDVSRGLPERSRGLDNPWVNGRGSILDAYYAWKQAEREQQAAERRESELEDLTKRLARLEERTREGQDHREALNARRSAVENRSKTRQLLEAAEQALQAAERARAVWPDAEESVRTAGALLAAQTEAQSRLARTALLDTAAQADALAAEIEGLERALARRASLPDDCERLRTLAREKERCLLQLSSAKLRAEIRLVPPHTATLRSASEAGRALAEGETVVDAEGFLQLSIPGAAELRVAPRELDVDGLQARLRAARDEERELLGGCGATDAAALEAALAAYRDDEERLKERRRERTALLRGRDADELRAEAEAIAVDEAAELPATLEADVRRFLTGRREAGLEAALAVSEAELERLQREFGSRAALDEELARRSARRETLLRQLEAADGELPDEDSFERSLAALEAELADADRQRAEGLQKLGSLAAQDAGDAVELAAETERRRAAWEREARKYDHYERIRRDFERLRAEGDDRLAVFRERFCANLAVLSDGRLQTAGTEGLRLQSGRNELPGAELLSEGTKHTVLLAFRLAVLSCFFPAGGGLVVLDDELLDMDPGRRRRAAALLQDFARSNQVVFTTCDPTVAELLGGRRIDM